MSQGKVVWDGGCAGCGFPRFFQNWSDSAILISSTQKPADLGHYCRCKWYCWVKHNWKGWAYCSGSQKQPKIQNAPRSALSCTADAEVSPVICKSDLESEEEDLCGIQDYVYLLWNSGTGKRQVYWVTLDEGRREKKRMTVDITKYLICVWRLL